MSTYLDPIQSTRIAYNLTSEVYAQAISSFHPTEEGEEFMKRLPQGGAILDVGCGTGRDAAIFLQKGFRVTGIDFSEKLLEIAKKTAPAAHFILGDIRTFQFPKNQQFDGIWANASLLHIEKNSIRFVLKKIHLWLSDQGALFISLKKGDGEVFAKDDRFGGDSWKFWSYYQESEIAKILSETGFSVLSLCTKEPKLKNPLFIEIQAQKIVKP